MQFTRSSSLFWLATIVITAVSGSLAGSFNNRWGVAAEMEVAGKRLADVPKSFGKWEMLSSNEVGRGTQEMLQCTGSLLRVYRHQDNGHTVAVALLVGPPGPISVHTPELCFSSRDYSQLDQRERVQVEPVQKGDEAVWELTFRKNDIHAEILHVAYAWGTGDGWLAPKEPRFSFAGQPYLYKLQVASAVSGASEADAKPCRTFLRDLLPVLSADLLTVHE